MSVCTHSALVHYTGIQKTYESRLVLESVTLDLFSGECHLLLGENGAGKSTLLRVMSGLLAANAGEIRINSAGLNWKEAKQLLRQKVMYLHQSPYLFDGTVLQNLGYAANQLERHTRKQSIDTVLAWAGLENLAGSQAKQLSGGEKQRLALARAKLRQAPILLLDEPSANLDQDSRRMTLELLASLKQEGVCLMIACHDPDLYEVISDGSYHLSKGALRLRRA